MNSQESADITGVTLVVLIVGVLIVATLWTRLPEDGHPRIEREPAQRGVTRASP